MSLRGFLALVGVVVVIFLIWQGIYFFGGQWIPAGHVGVMYSATNGLGKEVYPPKRIYVPPWHRLYTYPTLTKAAIYTEDADEGESASKDGIQVTTNDNANTTYDIVVYYRVKPEDVFTVFKSFGAIPIDDIQHLHIRRAVKEAANAVGTKIDAFQLMGDHRQWASQQLTLELQKKLAYKGITVEKALFCEAYPTEALSAKINTRVNSLTQLTISGIQQEIAKENKTAAITRATAEAEAAKNTAATTGGRSLEMLSLEADMAALDKWNGQLPSVQTKPGQTVVVPPSLLTGEK